MSGFERWLEPGALTIYLMHGVIPAARAGVRNYTGKHMPAPEFRALVEGLAAAGSPVGMEHGLAALAGAAELPPDAFLLTFDDGFANNHAVAAPLLEDLGVPAVFYATSGFLESGGGSWIDQMEAAVERTERRDLTAPWSGEKWLVDTLEQRIALLDEARAVIKAGAGRDPYELADELTAECGVGALEPDRDLDLKLSWDQARELHAHELFEVGGHGHTHRILGHLGDAELEAEIATSMSLMRRELGEVRHYSYPEGLEGCWDERVVALLRGEGVEASPTALPGVNRPGADPFELRRVMIA